MAQWVLPKIGFVIFVGAAALKALDATKPCNGDPAFCFLKVDQYTFVGMHNAEAVGIRIKNTPAQCIADCHEHFGVDELQEGLRYMDIDTCMIQVGDKKDIEICHGPGNGRLFRPEMLLLKEWLERNPREVVVITLGDANPNGDSKASIVMARLLAGIVNETYGDLLWKPKTDLGTIAEWPTLGELVQKNTRMIVMWGKPMYWGIYEIDKLEPGFREPFIRLEKVTASTYGNPYKTMNAWQLADYIEDFCETTLQKVDVWGEDNTSLLRVDGYLTLSAKRATLSICNKDMAGEVNPVLLEDSNISDNPLIVAQENCWKQGKHVSMVGMDYVEYFPQKLDTIGRALNTRNFARYGWVGGVLRYNAQFTKTSDGAVKDLLAKWGQLPDGSRILIDKNDAGNSAVYFSIMAPPTAVLQAVSNAEVLTKIKTAFATEPGVLSVKANCRDPGIPVNATREPGTQEFFEEDDTLTFVCKEATHGSSKRTCGPDGVFTGIQPRCLPYWTKYMRLLPLWAKILIVVGSVLCCCGCCVGGSYLIYRHCKKKKEKSYVKIDDKPANEHA